MLVPINWLGLLNVIPFVGKKQTVRFNALVSGNISDNFSKLLHHIRVFILIILRLKAFFFLLGQQAA